MHAGEVTNIKELIEGKNCACRLLVLIINYVIDVATNDIKIK